MQFEKVAIFEDRGSFYKINFKVMFRFFVFHSLIKGISSQKWLILKWWSSFFHFWPEIPFLKNCQKNEIVNLSWILVPKLIRICRIKCYVHFFCFDRKYPFRWNLVERIKIINLSWKLVPSLIQVCRIQ